jgi:hypothetical protein
MLRWPSRVTAVVLLSWTAVACSGKPDPITIAENTVTVENQTLREWRNVVITVNDHFRGGAPRLAAGGRLTAPLTQFQTAFGQRYDIGRQSVFKVEVTATAASGDAVKLQWGLSRR